MLEKKKSTIIQWVTVIIDPVVRCVDSLLGGWKSLNAHPRLMESEYLFLLVTLPHARAH